MRQRTTEFYETMCNKFKDSAKVWLLYAVFLQKSGQLDAMRKLMSRALNALPKRKRIHLIFMQLLHFRYD